MMLLSFYKKSRIRRMKPGELKRALALLSVFCVFLFVYLYWQQSNYDNITPQIVNLKRTANTPKRATYPPQWTWQCINQRCERRHVRNPSTPTTNPAIVSLATCSMLCGSTQLWPQPTGPVTLGSRAVTFNHRQFEFETDCQGPARALIQESFGFFNANIVNLVQNRDYLERPTNLNRVLIRASVEHVNTVRLTLHTNEGYNLTIKPHGNEAVMVDVRGKTYFGVRHGLETLSQLIWWDEYANNGYGSLKILKGATIQDTPIFPYRGVMVDTARNFMSIASLKRVIVGMAANKLNIFHWHITDSQSFPMLSNRVPQLAKTGAYSKESIYTPDEIKEFVEFARLHGVRVLLEIDTPAHAGNGWTWGPQEGLGELAVCVNERPWSLYCGEPPCGQLNPDNPNVYNILEKLYRDLLEFTNEHELFHLGGDEVNLECWAQHLNLNNKNKQLNYTDLHDLWGDFTLKALKQLKHANNDQQIPKVIMWSSNLSKRPYISKYLNKTFIVVQSWGASQWPDTPDLISDGYNVIISHVDAWYLDCGFGRWRETGDAACDPYRPWQTIYNHRPWHQFNLNKKQILGGEVCLWSEQLDEASLDARLWPRTAAFAERVWSDPQLDINSYTIQEDVYTRLNTQRERLVVRGLNAEALWPTWCVQNPGMCL